MATPKARKTDGAAAFNASFTFSEHNSAKPDLHKKQFS